MATKDKPPTHTSDDSAISIAELINSSYITSSKLSGSKNYLPWSAAIKTFLISKEKLKYIEEDKPEIAGSVGAKEDAQVKSWLWNSMEPHITCDVMLLPIAYTVWLSVKETYGLEGNIQRTYELCDNIFHPKQGTRPLHEHYSFVKAKWEELSLYQPYPGDHPTWKRQREELMIISFLAAHESAKNQILTGAELSSLNATFSRLSRISIETDQPEDQEGGAAILASAQFTAPSKRRRGRDRGSSGREGG